MNHIHSTTRIFVAGHTGLVGSALVRNLNDRGFTSVLTASRREVDLRDQAAVTRWFERHQPDLVFLAAGTVGGILANSTRPAEFIYDNLMILTNVIHAAYRHQVRRLICLGSSCIYPRESAQPIRESHLLTGPLEKTNEAYAIAKIAGLKMCAAYREQYGCDFFSVMPTNLYGPGDNFDPQMSHVLPGLMGRLHRARLEGVNEVAVWGSGRARREFLHVDDLASACVHLMQHYDGGELVNIGTGEDLSIRELAELIRSIVHPECQLCFDETKPDGTPQKLLDVSRLHACGWRHRIELAAGIASTYEWYCRQRQSNLPQENSRQESSTVPGPRLGLSPASESPVARAA